MPRRVHSDPSRSAHATVPDRHTDATPAAVKWAAALFLLHGLAVVLNAVVVLGPSGWADAWDLPLAVLRLIGTGVVAWGLLRHARWAWWLGLVLASWWAVAGALAVLVFERRDVYWLQPSGFQLLLVISLACVGGVVALLLSPSARALFRRRAA